MLSREFRYKHSSHSLFHTYSIVPVPRIVHWQNGFLKPFLFALRNYFTIQPVTLLFHIIHRQEEAKAKDNIVVVQILKIINFAKVTRSFVGLQGCPSLFCVFSSLLYASPIEIPISLAGLQFQAHKLLLLFSPASSSSAPTLTCSSIR